MRERNQFFLLHGCETPWKIRRTCARARCGQNASCRSISFHSIISSFRFISLHVGSPVHSVPFNIPFHCIHFIHSVHAISFHVILIHSNRFHTLPTHSIARKFHVWVSLHHFISFIFISCHSLRSTRFHVTRFIPCHAISFQHISIFNPFHFHSVHVMSVMRVMRVSSFISFMSFISPHLLASSSHVVSCHFISFPSFDLTSSQLN